MTSPDKRQEVDFNDPVALEVEAGKCIDALGTGSALMGDTLDRLRAYQANLHLRSALELVESQLELNPDDEEKQKHAKSLREHIEFSRDVIRVAREHPGHFRATRLAAGF